MSLQLRQLTRVDRADVWRDGRRQAVLERHRDRTTMRYVDDATTAVSVAMPLRDEPWDVPAGAVPSFFANLLPEGRRLNALVRAIGTSADDELSLLLSVGGDLVGDVIVSASGEPPHSPAPLVAGELTELRFHEVVGLPSDPVPERVGLSGVQPKASAGRVTAPVGASLGVDDFGPAILKLGADGYPGLVRNEQTMFEIAAAAGLPVPRTRIVTDADGVEGLLVERFDRSVVDTGAIVRHGQEDGCQVLSRWPADKYAVSWEETVAGLARHGIPSTVVLRDLLRQVAFAMLTGNGDQHAKNLSLLRLGGRWQASPAYDIPTTYPYGDTTFALTFDGRSRDVSRARFVDVAERLGLRRAATIRMLDDLLATVDDWLPRLDDLPFDARRRRKLARVVRTRAELLAGGS